MIVSRPSLWGNPYSLEDVRDIYPEVPVAERAVTAVTLYRRDLQSWALLSDYAYYVSERRWDEVDAEVRATGAKNMAEAAAVLLRGKDLACWCPLVDERGNMVPCHADVLLELANR